MMFYDYELFPFVVAQSSTGEIEIMQLTTGKSQKLKFSSYIAAESDNLNGARLIL